MLSYEAKKIQRKLKRKIPIKLIEKIGIEEFRLLSRMITIFESRHGNEFSFNQTQYRNFIEKCSKSEKLKAMLNRYLDNKNIYCFPTLTLRKPQNRGGKVEIKNITIKKLLKKEESKYYSKYI